MLRNNIIIILSMFLICLTSVFSTYPQASVLSTPNSLENATLTLEGWLGTSAKVELNNQIISSSLTFSNTNITSIPLDRTIDQVQINVAVGETFNFVHASQSEFSYDILIVKDGNQIFRQALSSGITGNIKLDEPGTYTIQDVTTGISKQFSVNYGLIEKSIPIELNYISDGMNSLKITSNAPSGQSSVTESTFSFEKYANSITFTSENVTKTSSITGTITAENLGDKFYYILNSDGLQPNCGSYAANQLNFSANGDEVTIRDMQEGNNIVRIVSTDSTCDIITGEYRFEVTVDRVVPRLKLIEATYGRSGATDSGEFEPEVFEQEEVYTNVDTITLFYDSSDIEKIEYILNGRGEGLLVNEEKIAAIPNIESFYVESDGSTVDIVLRPFSEYTEAYVLWSYDRIQERRENVRNGEIKISFELEDGVNEFNLTYFEGDGTDYMFKEIEIYQLAFEEIGELEVIEETDERGLYQINLDLEDGRNNITFLAYDQSGNVGKEVMTINIDTQDPQLVDERDFDPSPSSTVHFPIQELKGKVNKEDVYIEVFTIPEGERELNIDSNGRPDRLTCSGYKETILRGIDDLNRQRPRSTNLNLQEVQIDLSLQSLIINKESTRSDSNGNFEVYIGLEEESFDRSDVSNPNDRTIDRSTSRNTVCVVMADKYGNVNVEQLSYTLDSGNTMWKISEITTTPNSIYAAEIEQIGERRSGSGKVQFSMIARFQYLGPGTVDRISSFSINLNRNRDGDPFQGRGNILTSGINYVFDKSTNEMIAYVPIEINPLNKDPLDYPDEIKFNFQAIINYDLENRELPIDTANPIYFETLINIERPLDHTKWLTPSTIESGLEFINKTIKFTEKATNIMKYASLGSVLYCTGYKFYHSGVCLPAAGDDPEKIAVCNEKFYNVCDRVAGLESPPSCEVLGENQDGFVSLSQNANLGRTLDADDFEGGLDFYQDGQRAGNLENIRIRKDSNRCSDLNAPTGQIYVEISGDVNKFKEQSSSLGGISLIEAEGRINSQCVLAEVSGTGSNQKITSINLQQAGNLCYTPEAPVFDNTKCSLSLYGIENQPGSVYGGIPGKDPSTSILSSVQCGAVVDTYKHLQVALRVQEGIQKCLEQARIGEIKGGYCERLVSAAVCDIATNVILPELAQNAQNSIGKDGSRNGETLTSTFANLRKSEQAYNQRYEGTALSQTGLSTDQILNKVCIGALTGDWSVLEENILSTIDDTEVEPVFGPPIAESRLQGYNPLTGEVAIRYQFTYAAVSGGQMINTEVQFVCDPNAPNGDFCPENTVVFSKNAGSEFRQRILNVRRDEAIQDNIVITENKGRYWYNQIQFVHRYDVKGEQREQTQTFNIAHKSEMFAQCYWDGQLFATGVIDKSTVNGEQILPVGGIKCNSIFGEDSLLPSFEIDERNSIFLPRDQETFFPGNGVYLDFAISSRGNSQDEQLAIAHYTSCQTDGDGDFKLGSNTQNPPHVEVLATLYGDVNSLNVPVQITDRLDEVGTDNGNYVIMVDRLSSTQTHIGLVGTSAANSGEAFIKSMSLGGKELEFSNGIFETFVLQNANINQNNPQTQIRSIPIPNPNDENLQGKRLYIEFNGKPENIQFQVGEVTEGVFSGSGYPLQTAGKLTEGTCTVFARLLPESQANQLTLDNFKTYSPISQSDEEGNLIVDNRLNQNEIFTKTFQVKKPTTTLQHFSELISPIEDGVIGLDRNENKLPLKFIYQNSGNYNDLKPTIEVDFSIQGFGTIGTIENLELSESSSSNLNENVYEAILTLDSDELTKALDSLSVESNPTGLFIGSRPTIKATLTYRIIYEQGNNPERTSGKREQTKTIEFNIIDKSQEVGGGNTNVPTTSGP